MGQTTGISWADHTFNPHIGCAKVHAGCTHCYAERDFDTRRGVAQWGLSGTRVKTSDDNWRKPLKWNRDAEAAGERRRVFCGSLADVFEDWGGAIVNHLGQKIFLGPAGETMSSALNIDQSPSAAFALKAGWRPLTLNDVRRELFELIDATPWLEWLLLTKRPENVRQMWPFHSDGGVNEDDASYRNNVWLGTSVSDQATADEFVPRLLGCRDLCPVLFLSAEPLIGPLTFRWSKWQPCGTGPGGSTDHLDGLRQIDWIIAGGESGSGFRAMEPDWARKIRDECQEANVPFFFKQWSGNNPKTLGKEIDGREWCEFPK